jgi:hypothetical protein
VAPVPETSIYVDSRPSGATITIDGKQLPGVEPQSVRVAPNVSVHVHLELAGYAPFDTDYNLKPGKELAIEPRLSVAPALLHVETTPPGAQVMLAGTQLGETPLDSKPLAPAKREDLVLAHAGYETLRTKIDLVAGQTTRVAQTLKETQKFGTVTFEIIDKSSAMPFAHVSWKGKDLGVTRTVAGRLSFKLPAGRQDLTLTEGHKHRTIVVTIGAGQTQMQTVSFD